MWFEAELVFKDNRGAKVTPILDCRCCVFRQYVRESKGSTPPKSRPYSADSGKGSETGQTYGGSRPDGSKYTDPDTPAKEGAFIHTCRRIEFADKPRARGDEATWDFVGVVYDRCNGWAIVQAKRMIFRVEKWWKSPKPDEDEGRVEFEGSAWKDLPPPPGTSSDAWSQTNPTGEGGNKGGPPGTQVKPSKRPPKGQRGRKSRGRTWTNCCGDNWPTEAERIAAAEAEAKEIAGG